MTPDEIDTMILECANGHKYSCGGLTEGQSCPLMMYHDKPEGRPVDEWSDRRACGAALKLTALPTGDGEMWARSWNYSRVQGDDWERVEHIVYSKGYMPWSVVTSKASYDFEWCKRDDQLYYHDVGSPSIIIDAADFDGRRIWVADDVTIKTGAYPDYEEITVAEARKRGWPLMRKPALLTRFGKRTRNPFEAAGSEDTPCEYCDVCHDMLPSEEECDHMEWVEGHGVVGLGVSGYRWEDHAPSLGAIIHACPDLADDLARRMLATTCRYQSETVYDRIWQRLTHEPYACWSAYYDELPDDCRLGAAWLNTQDRQRAPEAFATTVEFISDLGARVRCARFAAAATTLL